MREGFGEAFHPIHPVVEPPQPAIYRYRWVIFASCGLAIIVLAYLLLVGPKFGEESPVAPDVAATIFPIYDITRHVAGDVLNVALVLPPNASPHLYEPTPSQVAGLQGVDLYFSIGHGLDDWADALFGTQAEKVVVDEGIAIMSEDDPHRGGQVIESEDEHEEAHAHDGTDPHYWLSIPNAKLIARTVEKRLVQRYPDHESEFEANLTSYLDELDAADTAIRTDFSDIQNRRMITLHDSWYYFGVAYGFTIAGTFEPTAGREPTPQYLAALSSTAKRIDAKVIYSEPQIASQGIAPFAEDYGLRIVELDPLGGVPGRDSYIKLMRYDAEIIRQHQD